MGRNAGQFVIEHDVVSYSLADDLEVIRVDVQVRARVMQPEDADRGRGGKARNEDDGAHLKQREGARVS
jgi:hypothetical protein